jgi:ribose 5-phosphate isomerase B
MKTIYIGADHAGFELKQALKRFLQQHGYRVVDVGAHKLAPTDDYPIYAYKVAKAVAQGKGMGILACGSAEGICIAANKIKGVRAVAVRDVATAKLSREHNDANVLCLSGGRMRIPQPWLTLKPKQAERIVLAWLTTPFSKAARHVRRLKQITRIEHGKLP